MSAREDATEAVVAAATPATPDNSPEALVGIPGIETLAQETTNSRAALLAMLDDMENSRRQIEHANHAWVTAFDAVRDMIFIHDESGRLTRVNRAYADRAGMPFSQIIGRYYWEIFPKAEAAIPTVGERHVTECGQTELTLETGEAFLCRSFPLPGETGNDSCRLHIVQDITERKLAEEKLRHSNELLEKVFSGVHLLIAYMDVGFNFIRVNSRYAQADGRTPDFYPGKNHFALFPSTENEAIFRHAVETGESYAVIEKPFEYAECPERGTSYWDWNLLPVFTADGKTEGLVLTLVDVTERVKAREKARQSETQFKMLFDSVNDAIFIHDLRGCFLEVNQAACEILGYSREELLARSIHDIDSPEQQQKLPGRIEQLRRDASAVFETVHVARSGKQIPVELSVRIAQYRNQPAVLSIARDITERKIAEENVAWHAEVNQSLAELSRAVLAQEKISIREISRLVLEHGQRLTGSVFGSACYLDSQTGYLVCPAITRDICINDLPPHEDVVFKSRAGLIGWVLEHRQPLLTNTPSQDPRSTGIPPGHAAIERFISAPAMTGSQLVGQIALANSPRDYSERDLAVVERLAAFYAIALQRKKDEQALLESEQRFRALIEHASDITLVCDRDFSIRYASPAAEHRLGHKPFELLGHSILDYLHPDDRNSATEAMTPTVCDARARCAAECRLLRQDGTWRIFELSCSNLLDEPAVRGIVIHARDISECRQAERLSQELSRALKTLSDCNRELVHATDETQLLQAMCRLIVETGGYKLAWVGYAENDETQSIRPVAWAGFEDGYLNSLNLTWADRDRGRGPTGRAIRTGKLQIAKDIQADQTFTPWREQALKQGFASSIALPLAAAGRVFAVLNIYSTSPDAFASGEIDLLQELADDLAFGIESLRTGHELDRAVDEYRLQLEKQGKSLEDVIQAIATTLEMRDPYTAGHQRRVASLATEIARGMGLPEEQVRGVHLGAVVHDLGKIRIPAEILTKPGRLTDLEFNFIKIHPQAGYDILRGIEFPWPIADMVLQHHERLDGSGYPQGLKGDEIRLESRILAVADVVEAMAAHRPYRAGLGIDAALGEVRKNRGIYYDPAVTDACIRLFTGKGYTLPAYTS